MSPKIKFGLTINTKFMHTVHNQISELHKVIEDKYNN